jgi:hypothetical protein
MKKVWMTGFLVWMAVAVAGTSWAELSVIGTAEYENGEYNLIYDSEQQLVWLDYSHPGSPWPHQKAWAEGLNETGRMACRLKEGIRISWDGSWRLPVSADGPRYYGYDGTTTAGFNITSCEMGHLFYNSLGNPGYYDTDGNAREDFGKPDRDRGGLQNTGPFRNLAASAYWSGTEYGIAPVRAWDFNMYFGSQNNVAFKSSYPYPAMAVRPGRLHED